MSISQEFASDRPIYAQLRERIVSRIHNGEWQPGSLIPGDMQLAKEYNVSQGTVRKAIDSLVDDQLVTRRQGRGTFLASHSPQKELFHFFHLVDDSGARVLPTSKVLSVSVIKSNATVAEVLALDSKEPVACIKRIRLLANRPTIIESVFISVERFPHFADRKSEDIPNALYEVYEKEFGVMIRRARETLDVAVSNASQAAQLGVDVGTPLLRIKRIAYNLEDAPVEYRESYCNSKRYSYLSNLL